MGMTYDSATLSAQCEEDIVELGVGERKSVGDEDSGRVCVCAASPSSSGADSLLSFPLFFALFFSRLISFFSSLVAVWTSSCSLSPADATLALRFLMPGMCIVVVV
jgi:hypothetical protein